MSKGFSFIERGKQTRSLHSMRMLLGAARRHYEDARLIGWRALEDSFAADVDFLTARVEELKAARTRAKNRDEVTA